MVLDSIGALARFEILIGFLLALITLLSVVGRTIWKVTGLIREQVDATKANTKAIRQLVIGLDHLEETTHDKFKALDAKVDSINEAGTRGLNRSLESIERKLDKVGTTQISEKIERDKKENGT